MKLVRLLTVVFFICLLGFATNKALNKKEPETIISWIDNQGYWTSLAARGIVPYNADVTPKHAVFTGNNIQASTVTTLNSPDVPVAEEGSTQSENSVFIDPYDETRILNSNNSTTYPTDTAFGANFMYSFNSGSTWDGEIEGAGVNNNGDPATVIGLNGRWYINYISSDYGMFVSYSDDEGDTWTVKNAANNPLVKCDKNHMWVDNNPDSPFEGNIYVSWTNTSDLDFGEIAISYSSDGGDTWTLNTNISEEIEAGSHNQGVNITTGPDGEVYAIWAVYDSWPSGGSDETAIAMSRSLDGGQTWEPARRIINNIRGLRATRTSKNMRVNSFPVAVVDNSTGADNGALYITWSNIGTPGQNTGDEINIYVVKSYDQGNSFSGPVKVTNDNLGVGKEHFFPWITCDPTTGILSMVYYDDRNIGGEDCEVYCANSIDGGQTWEEFKVSDVSFTPSPIPGLAADYMGDYLGINAKNGIVYPMWTDNRLGYAMTFCSPYETNPVNRPINLTGEVDENTGQVDLFWEYESAPGFLSFVIYRDGDSIGATTDTSFIEILPDYGVYRYRVTALYDDNIESGATGVVLTWGAPIIQVQVDSIYDHLAIGESSEHLVPVINQGQLDLRYNISLNNVPGKSREYCVASGGGGTGNEYISGVEVGNISNLNTGSDNYTDYYNLSTTMEVGHHYEIIVTNGNPYDLDRCGVWIDWNIDGEFTNDELTELDAQTLSPYFTGVISPPPGSSSGETKMRVRLQYSGDLDPCGSTFFGEVEDYNINLHGWLDIMPLVDTVSANDTSNVLVKFTTENLPQGNYYTNLIISSNDETSENIVIPIHLQTDQIVVLAEATPDITCPGTFVELKASVSGVFDSISYIWTSNPPGYSSTSPRHYVVALYPAWYIVNISDGDNHSVDSVYVDTYPIHNVTLGLDTSICAADAITLDAGPNGLSYLWSTGDTTQTITIDSTGTGFGSRVIDVDVLNEYDCTAHGNIVIEFANCASVPEIASSDISLFPNPAIDEINISSSVTINDFSLLIVNPDGKTIIRKNNLNLKAGENMTLELGQIPAGYYQIIIITDEFSFTKPLIILN